VLHAYAVAHPCGCTPLWLHPLWLHPLWWRACRFSTAVNSARRALTLAVEYAFALQGGDRRTKPCVPLFAQLCVGQCRPPVKSPLSFQRASVPLSRASAPAAHHDTTAPARADKRDHASGGIRFSYVVTSCAPKDSVRKMAEPHMAHGDEYVHGSRQRICL